MGRNEQVAKLKAELRDISKDPQQFLIESLHLVGYSGALANPLIAPEEALDRLDGSSIGKFYHVRPCSISLEYDF